MELRFVLGLTLFLPLGWWGLTPAPVQAQEVQERVTVVGQVVDRITGAPLEGAFVQPRGPYRGSLTDEAGRFQLSLAPGEDHELLVDRIGYAPLDFVLASHELGMSLRIEMDPQAIVLEGLEVFSEALSGQFERRRNSLVGVVHAYGTEEMMATGVDNGFQFFDEIFRSGRPCSRAPGWCALTPRGERPIRACIDGRPAWGGVEELGDYAPEALYLVEVDASTGNVRAYTWRWVRSGFRRRMVQMDPIVRGNPNAPRSAALGAFRDAFAQC